MIEILRDPIWQFIGAILAVAAIIISVTLHRKQRRHKALSYEIVSLTPVLSIAKEIEGKLHILFDGKPVQNVHLIVIKIINSGDLPIISTDYERPVCLSFGETAQILSVEVVKTDPDSLQASAEIEEATVVLMPTLMNQGDSVTLSMLVSQFDGRVIVDGRIVGVKDIQHSVEDRVQYFFQEFTVGLIVILIGVTPLILGLASDLYANFLAGIIMAGLLGFALQQYRFARARMRAYARLQTMTLQTQQTPEQVVRGSMVAGLQSVFWTVVLIAVLVGIIWLAFQSLS